MKGKFQPATLEQYIKWLRGFLQKGGRPTVYYRYLFEVAARDFLYVPGGVFRLHGELGADARRLIVARGAQKDPVGGVGDNTVMFLDGFTLLSARPFAPIYSDPGFLGLPGVRRFIHAQRG